MSPMLSLRYWQKRCSHSFVLYCFQHCQTHHNAVTRYSIILGDASKWTYGTYIYASVSFPSIKTQITIWIGFHQTLNHHIICNLTSVYNRFHTFYQLLNCWKMHLLFVRWLRQEEFSWNTPEFCCNTLVYSFYFHKITNPIL